MQNSQVCRSIIIGKLYKHVIWEPIPQLLDAFRNWRGFVRFSFGEMSSCAMGPNLTCLESCYLLHQAQ